MYVQTWLSSAELGRWARGGSGSLWEVLMRINGLAHCVLQFMVLHAVRTQVKLEHTSNVNSVLQLNATLCLPWASSGIYNCFCAIVQT